MRYFLLRSSMKNFHCTVFLSTLRNIFSDSLILRGKIFSEFFRKDLMQSSSFP